MFRIGFSLGWQDIRQNYRRSALGQFWIVASTAVMVATLALVFGTIYQEPPKTFLPYIACGLVLWNYLSGLLLDVSNSFIASEAMLRQLPLPRFTFVFRAFWRSTITFGHNLVLLPVVSIAVGAPVSLAILLLPVGCLIAVVAITGLGTALAFLATRFRDIPQVINSLMVVVFYATPVIWRFRDIPEGSSLLGLLKLNPFRYLLDVLRQPLLGQFPDSETWISAVLFSIISALVGLVAYRKYNRKVAYWI